MGRTTKNKFYIKSQVGGKQPFSAPMTQQKNVDPHVAKYKKNQEAIAKDTKDNIRFLMSVRDGEIQGVTIGQRMDAAKKLLDKQLPNKESVDVKGNAIVGVVELPVRNFNKKIDEADIEVIENE
jgi:hypothetical protein